MQFFRKPSELSKPNAPKAETASGVSRRTFLRRAARGSLAVGAGSLAYAWRVEPHWVEFTRRPLAIAGLPEQLVGKRLIQLSDLHVGPVVDQSFLIRSVQSLAEVNPDLIVITGDLMSCHGVEQIDRVAELMRELPSAPLGAFAIFGNHDYGDRCRRTDAVAKLTDRLSGLNVHALRNETADAGGLQIAGVDDLWARCFRPELALRDLASDRPAIALCHNPDGADLPAWEGYRGWILAGHTHGGQCKPPFLGPPRLPVSNRRYVAGEYELADGRRMYINRGLGYLQRIRFNCRPEITVFTLERAPAPLA